jgi:hypothetical protein
VVQEVQLHREILEESHLHQIEVLGRVLLAHLRVVKAEEKIAAEAVQLVAHLQAQLKGEEDKSIFNKF